MDDDSHLESDSAPLVANPVAPGRVERGFREADVEGVEAVKLPAEDEQVVPRRRGSRLELPLEQPDRRFEDQQLRGDLHAALCLAQFCGL